MAKTSVSDPAWGDNAADSAAVISSQREVITRLQSERDEDHATIARLEAFITTHLSRPLD